MSPSPLTVTDVLDVLPERRRYEAAELIAMMTAVTGADPVVWAGKIIGFGEYHYRYDSGHEGVAPLAGFAPTARQQTIYLVGDYQELYPRLVADLHADPGAKRVAPRMSTACLYLPRLAAVKAEVLRALVERSVRAHRSVDVDKRDSSAPPGGADHR